MKTVHQRILFAITLIVLAAGAAFAFNDTLNFSDLTLQLPPKYQMPEEPKPVETTLFFAGDIMLSRNVAAAMYRTNDHALPYENVQEEIRSADIAFANLESPFNDSGDHSVEGSLIFNADPKSMEGLKSAGFDVLSTANNHTMDQGKYGLNYTLSLLKTNGIDPVGTGEDCHDGIIQEADGMKFGFLAYSYTAYNDGGKVPDPLVCSWTDQARVAIDIKTLRPQVDFLVVSSHMGTEYKRTPDEINARGARQTIDAGADLFIGHHPHWVQTTEVYKGKHIFYSLGNFVFDQMWSQDTKEGLVVKTLFKDKKLYRITLLPVIIEDYCCPRWASDLETKTILSKLDLTSPILFGKN
jgi:poly-gamma-glutamate capsule biosynthesis protein CapA/YwtB (metallophosphatase superfamily)